jgi:peptide deformylase
MEKIKLTKEKLYQNTAEINKNNIENVLLIADEIVKWIQGYSAYAVAMNQLGFEYNCFITKGNRLGVSDEIFLNPKFFPQKKAKEIISDEGCLSFPGRNFKIKRFNKIIFTYQDKNLQFKQWKLRGIQAIICQHEIMHLAGNTEIDFDIT